MTGPSMLAMVTRALAMRAMMLIPAIVLIAPVARADGDAARGEKLYDDCVACHPVEAGVHGIGPTLHGIVGRKVGDIADYRYSAALRRSAIFFDEGSPGISSDKHVASVPANRMPYAGMTNAGDRADLIAYLQKVSR